MYNKANFRINFDFLAQLYEKVRTQRLGNDKRPRCDHCKESDWHLSTQSACAACDKNPPPSHRHPVRDTAPPTHNIPRDINHPPHTQAYEVNRFKGVEAGDVTSP